MFYPVSASQSLVSLPLSALVPEPRSGVRHDAAAWLGCGVVCVAGARLVSRACGVRVPLLATSGGGLVVVAVTTFPRDVPSVPRCPSLHGGYNLAVFSLCGCRWSGLVQTRASGGFRSVFSQFRSPVLGCQSVVAPTCMDSRPCSVSGVRSSSACGPSTLWRSEVAMLEFPIFGVPAALASEGLVIPTGPCSRGSPPLLPSARGSSSPELGVGRVAKAAVAPCVVCGFPACFVHVLQVAVLLCRVRGECDRSMCSCRGGASELLTGLSRVAVDNCILCRVLSATEWVAGDIPCKTCAKNKLERSRKSQKTRYLSTASKDLSTDTTSQKATSSAKALPVDSRSSPVDRCNQSEDQKLWKACAYRQQQTTCRQMHTVRAFSLLSEIVCYECKKQGHMRGECPELKKKLKKDKFTFKKAKAMVATWSDEDDDQNSQATSGDDEVHYLMARSDDSNEVR
ncbi:hypothetical protein Taro_040847 [Colocasia esculenta]|uniref:CCHC-type domain-containing protein n=1 Tax=Colocasia esculenta TaxID=4460 RepID=A0A843WZ97_COLES|nr:hypothetical protein [Colocasia esculenta]